MQNRARHKCTQVIRYCSQLFYVLWRVYCCKYYTHQFRRILSMEFWYHTTQPFKFFFNFGYTYNMHNMLCTWKCLSLLTFCFIFFPCSVITLNFSRANAYNFLTSLDLNTTYSVEQAFHCSKYCTPPTIASIVGSKLIRSGRINSEILDIFSIC